MLSSQIIENTKFDMVSFFYGSPFNCHELEMLAYSRLWFDKYAYCDINAIQKLPESFASFWSLKLS